MNQPTSPTTGRCNSTTLEADSTDPSQSTPGAMSGSITAPAFVSSAPLAAQFHPQLATPAEALPAPGESLSTPRAMSGSRITAAPASASSAPPAAPFHPRLATPAADSTNQAPSLSAPRAMSGSITAPASVSSAPPAAPFHPRLATPAEALPARGESQSTSRAMSGWWMRAMVASVSSVPQATRFRLRPTVTPVAG